MLELSVDALGRRVCAARPDFTHRIWEYEVVRNHLRRGVMLHVTALSAKNDCLLTLRLEEPKDLFCALFRSGYEYTGCYIYNRDTTSRWLSHKLVAHIDDYDVQYLTELLHKIRGV